MGCPICMEPYSNGNILTALLCGHVYHTMCVMSWVNRDDMRTKTCPTCKSPVERMVRLYTDNDSSLAPNGTHSLTEADRKNMEQLEKRIEDWKNTLSVASTDLERANMRIRKLELVNSVRLATEEMFESKHRAIREKWKALNRKDLRQINSNLLEAMERQSLELRQASKKAETNQRKMRSMATELESYKKRSLKAEQELRRKDMKLAQLQHQLEQRGEDSSQNGLSDGQRKRRRSSPSSNDDGSSTALPNTISGPLDALEMFAENTYHERQRKVARPMRAQRLAGFLDHDPSEDISQPVSDDEIAPNDDMHLHHDSGGDIKESDSQESSQQQEVTEFVEHSPDVVELSGEEGDDITDAGSPVEEQLDLLALGPAASTPAQDMIDSDDRLQEQLQRTISRIRAHLNPIVIPDDDVIDLVSSDEEA